jgi:hypothetical protein
MIEANHYSCNVYEILSSSFLFRGIHIMPNQNLSDHSVLEKLNADLDKFIEERLAYAEKNPHYRDGEREHLKMDPETLANVSH